MSYPTQVRLIDVGPRDGLQNEKQPVPAAIKIELVQRLPELTVDEVRELNIVAAPGLIDLAAGPKGLF